LQMAHAFALPAESRFVRDNMVFSRNLAGAPRFGGHFALELLHLFFYCVHWRQHYSRSDMANWPRARNRQTVQSGQSALAVAFELFQLSFGVGSRERDIRLTSFTSAQRHHTALRGIFTGIEGFL